MYLQAAFSLLALCIALPVVKRLLRGRVDYSGKHVLITGGSSGIGKSIAREFVRNGSHVTILARTESKLKAACEELRKGATGAEQKIEYAVADVSDFQAVKAAVESSEKKAGPIDVVIANAGSSQPGYFLEQDVSVFRKAMEGNYMGTVNIIKAVAPSLTQRRQGQIVIVASAAAVVSFIGYSSYAPSKWALRGLADTLRNELLGFDVTVHIAYPPDTDTPGFEEENKAKPAECAAFSQLIGGKPYPADEVARHLVNGLAWRMYHLPSPDFIQNRLVDTMAGVSPRSNAVLEWLTLPLLAFIEWVVLLLVDSFGRKYGSKKKRE
uniref:3-dehydrosphinganine reductase n=1 Tax=Guillardia theta TaxID=55529 RepID=A0A7S4PJ59_GUITH